MRLLRAQNRMYRQAKRIHFARIIAVLALELAAPFVVLTKPEWKDGLELVGALLTLISALILSGIETDTVRQAATVQEQLDVHLFQLPWNTVLVGSEVAPELIHRASCAYKGSEQTLRNWYPNTSGVAYPKDALLCQRTNLMWGVRLQRGYAYALIGLTAGYLLLGIIIGLARGESFWAYLVAILVPALPALLEAIDTYKRHTESAQEKAELLAYITTVFDRARTAQSAILVDECRHIQDAIYITRSTRPLVPDWWHRVWRSRYDADARAAVEDLKKRI